MEFDSLKRYAYRNLTSNDWTIVPWADTSSITNTLRVYSETDYPLEPFIIITDDNNFWWLNDSQLLKMETTNEAIPRPTIDSNRREINSKYVSDLTLRFNRFVKVFNSPYSFVYYKGNL
jgi:hypothetical protein